MFYSVCVSSTEEFFPISSAEGSLIYRPINAAAMGAAAVDP
jgi:hypothetical protein